MSNPTVERILDILAKETFVDRAKLAPEATIEELGIASLDVIQAIFALETEFNIEIPVAGDSAGGAEFTTVQDLVGHVLKVIEQTGPAEEARKSA
jgi:acyl carrier protein